MNPFAPLTRLFGGERLRFRILRNVVLKALAEMVPRGATFVFTIVAARLIGKSDFGRLSYSLALGALATIPVDLGWNTIVVRRLAAASEGAVVGPAVWFKLVMAAIIFVVVPVFAAVSDAVPIPVWLVAAGLVAYTCYSFQDFMGAVATGLQRIEWEVVVKSIPRVLLFLALPLFFVVPASLKAVALLLAAVNVVGLAIGGAWLARRVPHWNAGSSVRRIWILAKEAAPFGLVSAIWMLYVRSDLILLGAFKVPAAELGYYGTAARLLELARVAPLIVQMALIPIFSALARNPADVRRHAIRMSLYLIAGAAALSALFWFISAPLVTILFGADFRPAYEPLRIGGCAMAIMLVNVPFIAALIALNRERWMLATTGGALVASVVTNVVLIPSLTYRAPAWGFVAGETAWLLGNAAAILSARRTAA